MSNIFIYPRFLAQFLAWLIGYFWLPCPHCGEMFAGFEVIPFGGRCYSVDGRCWSCCQNCPETYYEAAGDGAYLADRTGDSDVSL